MNGEDRLSVIHSVLSDETHAPVVSYLQILVKEYAEKVDELENKLSATLRKQTTMVLQKEAITHERDVSKMTIRPGSQGLKNL